MELLILLTTVIVTSVVWFFVWRNNKKKFLATLINLDGLIDRNDTQEELEAKVDKALAGLRADLISKAGHVLYKLQ